MSALASLERQRTAYKGRITKLEARVNAIENSTTPVRAEELNEVLESVSSLREKVREIDENIYLNCEDDDAIQRAVEESDQMDVRITNLLVSIRCLKGSSSPIPGPSTSASNNGSRTHEAMVRLPKLELPVFDGNFENWQSFQDLFSTTVDSNIQLSKAQKLQYLKSCVKHEAFQLIKSYTITDSHYDAAWAALKNRYDNTREITHALIKRMFQIAPLRKESASGLRRLLDITNECLRSLNVIGRPTDTWYDLIVYMMVERLDPDTRRRWAISLCGTSPPTLFSLESFLEQHIRGLIAGGEKVQSTMVGKKQASAFPTNASSNGNQCFLCKDNHPLFQCNQFLALSVEQRRDKLRKSKHCWNCLKPNHFTAKCQSKLTCKSCGRRHNTLLHLTAPVSQEDTQQKSDQATTLHVRDVKCNHVLLKTALVCLNDINGVSHTFRAFLDSGSEVSFISENCRQQLGLKPIKTNIQITGLASRSVGTCKSKVECILSSKGQSWSTMMEAYVIRNVASFMPSQKITPCKLSYTEDIELADPEYFIPRKVDVLLGADMVSLCMLNGVKHGTTENEPTAFNTVFGWVLCGKINCEKSKIKSFHIAIDTNDIMQKFWSLEEVPNIKHLSPIEQACEDHFAKTHSRDTDGRYIIALPFNDQKYNIGPSKEGAMKRFFSLERKLRKYPQHRLMYNDFMSEYESLGHMAKLSNEESQKPGYYLPHHYVMKEESTSTKLRFVFDASFKSQSGVSLNDALKVGPTIQDELLCTLIRFRTYPVAIKADIKKMYRQFRVTEEDSLYQRILWRKEENLPIHEYKLLTVTYGTSSASYLATKCLQQLAEDEGYQFPHAASAMKNNMYVDDLLSGATTMVLAKAQYEELMDLAKKGGLEFTKWMSNSKEFMDYVPKSLHESQDSFDVDGKGTVGTLGVKWAPSNDSFIFKLPQFNIDHVTKRILLSNLAKIFDPLGFLVPFTISAKIMLQELWKDGKDWDDQVDFVIMSKWSRFVNGLSFIGQLMVPRLLMAQCNGIELHGFSDASEKAYCAVVYMRSLREDSTWTVNLVIAKTRVAPLKTINLPRLELCGALLLSNLIKYVIQSLKFKGPVYAWTDSSIVLCWLKSYPSRWQTFVANRVAAIHDTIPSSQWRYVPGNDNPADCGTRGMDGEQLPLCQLWWNGPSWLISDCLPTFNYNQIENRPLEERTVKCNNNSIDLLILDKFSNLNAMINVMAYVLRFIHNIRNGVKYKGPLQPNEVENSTHFLLKLAQRKEFQTEVDRLLANKAVHTRSRLLPLNPFIDKQGILRVGGRLKNANEDFGMKHPIILPYSSNLSNAIVRDTHRKLMHGGFQIMMSSIRQQYWILNCRNLVRKLLNECVLCKRYNARAMKQLMGSLPTSRVNVSSPFNHTGVDFAGPYNVLRKRGRGIRPFKCYLAVFICFTTKAIHIEYVSDLSAEAFLGCLKRFVSRRGLPAEINSDNGTNFVKANKIIQHTFDELTKDDVIWSYLNACRIKWNFIPPSAPHHGGLYESAVRSIKYHLKRVMGNQLLTMEEFQTLLACVEGILNSRPICAMNNAVIDYDVLTPGHFLIGRPLNCLPEFPDGGMRPITRWRLVQQMTKSLWDRWRFEYRNTLQERFKWKQCRPNVKIGDVVVIFDNLCPIGKWKLGRVVHIYPGNDGYVRVVDLKTSNGIVKRSISKLAPILCE